MQEKITQVHNTTPEQLAEAILRGVNSQFEKFKEEFQPKEPTEYLTRKEVAKLLSVNLSTIHNWTVKGKLKAYGIGHRVYYKRQELNQNLIPLK